MSRPCLPVLCLMLSMCAATEADDAPFPGERSTWNDFDRYDFEVDGRPVLVVVPDTPAPGQPWVWHGEFFGHKPAPDIALLERGFHVVYMRVPDMLGCPDAVGHWNAFYRELTTRYRFAPKAALVGLSRGGLYCYNWAAANPDKVACIYGDAPVCDFKSWPGGFGTGRGSPAQWQLVLERYGFDDEAEALAYNENPIDNLQPLANAGVPLLHVYGDADDVVPWEENTGIIAERYRELGGEITLIGKPGVGHHPHGLDDSTTIVEFIARHASPPSIDGGDVSISPAVRDENGFLVHTIRSRFQAGETELLVLLPDDADSANRKSVLFVLPVEAGRGDRYGNGLLEVQRADLHNKHGLICVMPTFSHLPWYCNHPTNPEIRQESYLTDVILPLLRWEYPNARHDRDGRLLVGFSKSGCGAWSLMLRNPDLFGWAAAWDAPLMLDAPGQYGSGPIYGSEENFEQFHITSLLSQRAEQFQTERRLMHLGYGNFRDEHERIERQLTELGVAHLYRDGPHREHHWNSGWVIEAVGLLDAVSSASAGADDAPPP